MSQNLCSGLVHLPFMQKDGQEGSRKRRTIKKGPKLQEDDIYKPRGAPRVYPKSSPYPLRKHSSVGAEEEVAEVSEKEEYFQPDHTFTGAGDRDVGSDYLAEEFEGEESIVSETMEEEKEMAGGGADLIQFMKELAERERERTSLPAETR